jgi:NADH:ubiquinone oxidoreductase subunit 4 (subunit M)
MVPAYIWLPEAHIEACTAGITVILAGILYKSGYTEGMVLRGS